MDLIIKLKKYKYLKTNEQKSKGTCQGYRGTDEFPTNMETHKQKKTTHTSFTQKSDRYHCKQ